MSDKPTDFPQPLGGNEMPRFAGPGTMMRIPAVDSAAGMDAVFIGIPLDIGTSNRSGTRFGPKQIRAESVLMCPYNMWTRAAPFDSLRVGDLGDVPINTFDLKDSVARITAFYNEVLAHDVVPLTLGGDHTLTLPVLRAVAAKHGPVGLIHVDAHADINDHMFGEKIAHGTPFRRAVEEGLIDSHRTWQIGLRGTGYTAEDFDWARDRGFTVVQAEELWHRSATPLIEQARDALGDGRRHTGGGAGGGAHHHRAKRGDGGERGEQLKPMQAAGHATGCRRRGAADGGVDADIYSHKSCSV